MAGLHNSGKSSLAGRTFGRFLRFGVLRGLRPIEIDPEDFRLHLANKHGLWVEDFARMKDVPTERLDAIATALIRNAERLALAEGAGFGLGGMMTFLPDASLLTVITLRLIQRLSLLYGFELTAATRGLKMWKAAAAASGIDYGRDLAEKQIPSRNSSAHAERFAAKIGAETAEKWAGRLIPLASSAIGGAPELFVCERLGAAACSVTFGQSISKRKLPRRPRRMLQLRLRLSSNRSLAGKLLASAPRVSCRLLGGGEFP